MDQTLFNYIAVIFFSTTCIMIFIRFEPDEINVTRTEILFRKKLSFLKFKQSIKREDIQIIKYELIKNRRNLHSGHLLIICHNGRRHKFLYISRVLENELIEDLQLIVDKFKKVLLIS